MRNKASKKKVTSLVSSDLITVMEYVCKAHKRNEVDNVFPIFKVSRFAKVRTDSHHNGHNKTIFFCLVRVIDI